MTNNSYPNQEPSGAVHLVVDAVQQAPSQFGFGLGAILLATVLFLSGFAAGRKLLLQVFWFFDSMLGGAPHTVTLPGPVGYPIVGNLYDVSLRLHALNTLYTALTLNCAVEEWPRPEDR